MADEHDLLNTAWHTRKVDEVLADLATDVDAGLPGNEAKERLERYGPNQIRSAAEVPWWRILVHQFADPLIYILLIAAVVSLFFEEYVDMTVILAVVAINGSIGFVQELRARKAILALAKMAAPTALVVRDGRERDVPSEQLVPGDIVVLTSGSRVPADLRLYRARDLEIDESALTGESEPAAKGTEPVADEHAVPGDQLNIAFLGTNVTRGRGRGVVVRTGRASELGRIAETVREMGDVQTPIQEKMHRLGKAIGIAVFILALVVAGGGVLVGMPLNEIVRTAVALAVGAVPEALPVVLTVTLAVGVQRMARRNAIIRSLPAVETLGSTTVVGSDKTGTLTANEMTVKAIWTGGARYRVTGSGYDTEGAIEPEGDKSSEISDAGRMTVLAGLLANETSGLPNDENERAGDPTEIALLVAAVKAGLSVAEARRSHPEIDVIPFESERQFMASLNDTPEGRCVFLKGAPEAVLDRCSRQLGGAGEYEDLDLAGAREAAVALAEDGYRVLAMAFRYDELDGFDGGDPGGDFVFAGFQAMEDPLRPEAMEAVIAAQDAGIRVLMLTGDHGRTARAIGRQLGLAGDDGDVVEGRDIDDLSDEELDEQIRHGNIYARVSPEHKLRLVERLKAHGHIVAVTGDGVNDAPALQAAHLGIAMGRGGTDVAREASDMVLADDNFASITNAVEEGRVVFANIRKVTYFLLSTGVGLVITILSSLFGPWPLPYVAAQVLWINLVTKGLQDVALAFEPGEPGLLKEPPRDPREGVLNRPVLWRMWWLGLFMAIGTMAVYWWVLQQEVSLELARSVAMTQMVMFQFFHLFNCRSMHRSLFRMRFLGNPYVLGSVMLALLAHLSILHVSWLQAVFETEPLSLDLWLVIVPVSLTIIIVSEIDKALFWRRRAGRTGEGTTQSDAAERER